VFLILPILFWKKLSPFSRFALLVFLGYTLYLIAVGGDVLKAHRFFVPILFFFYLPVAEGLYRLLEKTARKEVVFAAAVLLAGFYAYQFPRSYLDTTALYERGLVEKMANLGRLFVQHNYAQSFATSTIGALSYYAGECRVIDMLGLTQPEIATNPETIEGIESSWKEKHFNARWVLAQKPEVILFSTELKPSSPAERALYLYPEFRQNYRLDFLFGNGRLSIFYRKFRDYVEVAAPDQPARFANLIHDGLNLTRVDNAKAAAALYEAISSGGTDCAALHSMAGYLFSLAGQPESSEVYLRKAIALDGGGSLGEWYYSAFLYERKRYREALDRLSSMIRTHPTAEAFLESRGILRPNRPAN
jgi:hypothetical protein